MSLSLGLSPCPNDTFIFHALLHGAVEVGDLSFEPRFADVEILNRRALDHDLDVSKVSYGVLPYLLDEYVLLRSGGALGRGCGPLIVAREKLSRESLSHATIAIPGRFTTANLLMQLYQPDAPAGSEMEYSRIMAAVEAGQVDAGLIIHESRFTYPQHGLTEVVDLGAWWEEETGLPIPLGGIVARRSLGATRIARIDDAIRRSVEYAFADPTASSDFVRLHAQETSDDVTRRHIELYVNPSSLDLGHEGEAAVSKLIDSAAGAGLISAGTVDPFVSSASIKL